MRLGEGKCKKRMSQTPFELNSLQEALPSNEELRYRYYAEAALTEADMQQIQQQNQTNKQPQPSPFAEDGEPTEAERKEGRKALDRFLFREYYAWWDAFVEEAKEDIHHEHLTALDRFSIHCARQLKKRVGSDFSLDTLETLVVGWFSLHFH